MFFTNRGKQGRSVLMSGTPQFRYFLIQNNIADFQDIQIFKKNKLQLPFSCALKAERTITYCPHCGTNLHKWIAEHPNESAHIIELSRGYLIKNAKYA
jgi:hypothetical protein